MRKHGSIWLALFLSVAITSALPQGTPAASDREQLYSALTGDWTGQLEYRDFSNDQRVVLPTWLEVSSAEDGRSLRFSNTYDDGPTKTVTEKSTVTVDTAARRFTIRSDRDNSSDSYSMLDFAGFTTAGHARFTLAGTGKENDHAVDVRITVTIDRNMYRFLKETRPPGGEFSFRDGYVFTRRDPADRK